MVWIWIFIVAVYGLIMNDELQQFIHELVDSTNLRGRVKSEVFRELTSHVLEEEKELQLQGYSEERITSTIIQRFGDTQLIAQELYMTNTAFSRSQMIGYGILLWFVVSFVINFLSALSTCFTASNLEQCGGGLLFSLIFPFSGILLSVVSIFLPFFLVYLAALLGVYSLLRIFLCLSKVRNLLGGLTSGWAALWIVAQAALLHWSSLFLSVRPVHTSIDTIETSGFPLKVFDFPPPPMGSDQPPFEMWPRFYINFALWLVGSILLFTLLPRKIKNNPRTSFIITVIGGVVSICGTAWLLFKFD